MSTPAHGSLPRYVAPLPRSLEDLALRLAYPIAAVNLAGTAFGFYYYRFQLSASPILAWPFIPTSPTATLFIACSLVAYKRGWDAEWLHMLAFFGTLKLGLWTPFVQVFLNGQGDLPFWLYQFLIWSHLSMATEAFVIQRYADFSLQGITVAVAWYVLTDLFDYFVPIGGAVHHTWLRVVAIGGWPAVDYAAGAAVILTVLATYLALTTRVKKLEVGLGTG